ncbi:MAG: nucleotidyltransferase [Acidimicrobiales bacterium]
MTGLDIPEQPAMAPGANFVEARSGAGGADDGEFAPVLATTVATLDAAGVAHVFMGGIGAATYGRPRWTHDIDVFVRPEDAGPALRALAEAGFRTEQTYPDWLYKAFRGEVMVDLIFKSMGGVLLDDEMLARSRVEDFEGQPIRMMAPEDLLVIKAIVHDEHMPRHWHDALAIVSRCDLDWDYVVERARRHGARRVLSLMLYAQSNDLIVPAPAVRTLFEAIYGP